MGKRLQKIQEFSIIVYMTYYYVLRLKAAMEQYSKSMIGKM